MNTFNNNEFNTTRGVFIETLSDEFISKTGVGAYAYLAPMDIHQLFKDYLKQKQNIRCFVKLREMKTNNHPIMLVFLSVFCVVVTVT